MNKVLIISYFFPPANFVGAQRTAAWAKYLHQYGYYPIIITRQWNEGQTDLVDRIKNNTLEIEKNQTHEVHRLPYTNSLRDRLANYPALKVFQKALTLKELVLSNYSIKQLPFYNFYTYSKNLIHNDSDINIVIASGRPFQAFFIGHQLKKEFPNIHWIPDYRDEWTTHQSPEILRKSHLLFSGFEKRSEVKWTSNASFFISVTPKWTSNIKRLIKKGGKTIYNGFDNSKTPYTSSRKNHEIFELSYLGSTYSNQDFKKIIISVNNLSKTTDIKFRMNFFGSNPKQVEHIFSNLNADENLFNIHFYNRIDRKKLLKKVKHTDVFFLTSLGKDKNWLPVKLFDYFNSDKPILLCPSDNGLMDQFIKETESGFVADTTHECEKILHDLINKKKNNQPLINPRNHDKAYFYSRKYQTSRLADVLNELNKNEGK